jgi:sugar lactone lactonase YvrE
VSTQADLLKGQVERLSIDYEGRLALGPAARTVLDATSPFIWCLAKGPDGSIYAGGGNDGVVWRIDREGRSSVAFDARELEVHALAVAADGTVFVATSPDGKVYKVDGKGAASVFFDPEDKYIWSLAIDGQGRLYVGSGDKGVIYRVTPDGKGDVFYRTQTTHATSMTFDRQGQLLVGTESPGRIMRITPAGKAFVLLDSPYREIRGLRVDQTGAIYAAAVNGKPGAGDRAAGTAPPEALKTVAVPSVSTEITAITVIDMPPATAGSTQAPRPPAPVTAKGAVYRIDASGGADVIWEFRDDQPFDLSIDDDGSVLVATGNTGKLYRLGGDPWRAMLVTRLGGQQVTSILAAGPTRYFATSNPAHVVRVDESRAAEGTYLSEAKDAGTVASWGTLTWRAIEPAPGRVRIATRSGNTSVPDETWSEWSGPYEHADGEAAKSPPARYFQWRAVLSATAGDKSGPVLVSLSVAYLQRNLRPRVTGITVHPPGIVFQKPYPAGEPEIAGMGDVPSEARAPMFSSPLGAGSASSSTGPALGRRMYQKGLQAFAWKAEDDNDDRLEYDVFFRSTDDAEWKVLRRNALDQILVWDTMSAADGTYVVKIAASDAVNNPPGSALVGELESAAFEIDNGAPTITVLPPVRDGSGTKVVFDVRDAHSAISTVEYSIDTGRWQQAYPVDGVADSRSERYEIKVEGDAAGRVVIRAADVMNNAATGRVEGSGKAR